MDRINGSDWVDIGGGRRGFVSQNATAGIAGTEVTSAFLNGVQEELLSIISDAGLEPNAANWSQVLTAIAIGSQSGKWSFGQSAGSSPSIEVTLQPTLPSYRNGLVVRFVAGFNCSGATTINVNSLGKVPLLSKSGSPLRPYDFKVGEKISAIYHGGEFFMLSIVPSEYVIPASGNLVLYVRPDGNDLNDGSANNAASAFKTIQGAFEAARRRYILSGYTLTIKLGMPGSYPGLLAQDFAGTIVLDGSVNAPENYTITNQTAAISPIDCRINTLTVMGCRLAMNVGTTQRNVFCQGGRVVLDRCRFSSMGAARTDTFHIRCASGGLVVLKGNCAVDVGARNFIYTYGGGSAEMSSEDATCSLDLVNNPAFTAFSQSNEGSVQYYRNVTFTGVATGTRYSVGTSGGVVTWGAGENFLPGNSAGFNSGGYYV